MPIKSINVADIEKLRVVPCKGRVEFFCLRLPLERLGKRDLHARIFPLLPFARVGDGYSLVA